MFIMYGYENEIGWLMEMWQDFRGWILGLGLTGVILIAIRIILSIKNGGGVKKALNLQPIFVRTVDDIKSQVVAMAKEMVSESKKIKDEYVELIKENALIQRKLDGVLKMTSELNAIVLTLTNSTPELKAKALEIFKQCETEIRSLALLEQAISRTTTTDNALDDIISGKE